MFATFINSLVVRRCYSFFEDIHPLTHSIIAFHPVYEKHIVPFFLDVFILFIVLFICLISFCLTKMKVSFADNSLQLLSVKIILVVGLSATLKCFL